MVALTHVAACAHHCARDAPRRVSLKPAGFTRGVAPRVTARRVAVHASDEKREKTGVSVESSAEGPDAASPSASPSRRFFSVGLFAPLGVAYDAVGRWLVAHPAPQWVVNSPAKTKATAFLASVLNPEFDVEVSKSAVQKWIASDDVVVFSATYCPFSAAAKQALKAEGVPFTAVEWNKTQGGAGFAPALAELYGRSSIPHVFIAGRSIGGCNDGTPGIRPLIASGELDEALLECSQRTRDARAAFLNERRGDVRRDTA